MWSAIPILLQHSELHATFPSFRLACTAAGSHYLAPGIRNARVSSCHVLSRLAIVIELDQIVVVGGRRAASQYPIDVVDREPLSVGAHRGLNSNIQFVSIKDPSDVGTTFSTVLTEHSPCT